ncbi:MAG TPA: NAD(P)H-dependent oxidoreductase [Polyangiaceae bacterium]|nr:NAD(P)H-dependent oxidoreductase [Polyangiaceae bacterium]
MAAIGVIVASVREGRRGETFAKWLLELARPHANLELELVDLRDWPLPAYSYGVQPIGVEKLYVDGSLQSRWAERIRGFDGFVVVSPEYNRGYPGHLKNALDALYSAWNYKPVAFLTYGGVASGSRAAQQLAQVATELRMVPVRDEVNVSLIGLAVDTRGFPTAEIYTKKAQLLLTELGFWAELLKAGRERHPR